MNRLFLLTPFILAACGAYHDPCVRPCPETVEHCECQPFQGGGSLNFTPAKEDVKPEPKPPVKPDPKPDHHKPEKPKHEPKGKDDDC